MFRVSAGGGEGQRGSPGRSPSSQLYNGKNMLVSLDTQPCHRQRVCLYVCFARYLRVCSASCDKTEPESCIDLSRYTSAPTPSQRSLLDHRLRPLHNYERVERALLLARLHEDKTECWMFHHARCCILSRFRSLSTLCESIASHLSGRSCRFDYFTHL